MSTGRSRGPFRDLDGHGCRSDDPRLVMSSSQDEYEDRLVLSSRGPKAKGFFLR